MSANRFGHHGSGPNALRDQAAPNVLHAPGVHAPLPQQASHLDDDRRSSDEGRNRRVISTRHGANAVDQAGAQLYALAREFASRSDAAETQLLERFQAEAAPWARRCGDLVIRDTDEAWLSFRHDGSFAGDVALDDAVTPWRALDTARDVVSVFDPSDLLAALADRLTDEGPGTCGPDAVAAGRRLGQLAKAFAELSARHTDLVRGDEVGLIERFEKSAAPCARMLGATIVRDDSDERITLDRDGSLVAEVVPEGDESSWRMLRTVDQLAEYYSPEELFRALADHLATAYPGSVDDDAQVAGTALRSLALLWREQCLDDEALLFAEFNVAAGSIWRMPEEFVVVDDDDERLLLDRSGQIRARVLDWPSGTWRELDTPDRLVESYDPTDVFTELAEALSDRFPKPA